MTTIVAILLLVVLSIIIARCNGSSDLGRNLLISLGLGVVVGFGIKTYNSVKTDNEINAKIEKVCDVYQAPTQLGLPVVIQVISSQPGAVSKVLVNKTTTLYTEGLRLVNNSPFEIDIGNILWDSS